MLEHPPPYHMEAPAIFRTCITMSGATALCLKMCYHVDQTTIPKVIDKFGPLLDNIDQHDIVHEFIQMSNALNIDFSNNKTDVPLPTDDAVSEAPEWHEVLFESPYVRILWELLSPVTVNPIIPIIGNPLWSSFKVDCLK